MPHELSCAYRPLEGSQRNLSFYSVHAGKAQERAVNEMKASQLNLHDINVVVAIVHSKTLAGGRRTDRPLQLDRPFDATNERSSIPIF